MDVVEMIMLGKLQAFSISLNAKKTGQKHIICIIHCRSQNIVQMLAKSLNRTWETFLHKNMLGVGVLMRHVAP